MHHHRADGSVDPVEECRIYQAFQDGRGVHVTDEVYWRADGTPFPVEYWSYPVRRDGQLVGCAVSFLDITERVSRENELRSARRDAEEACALAIAELEELRRRLRE
jgi:PAS domain S-box-containing protein